MRTFEIVLLIYIVVVQIGSFAVLFSRIEDKVTKVLCFVLFPFATITFWLLTIIDKKKENEK